MDKYLKNLGCAQRTTDKCLFTRKKKDKTLYIIVYVDDLLIAGSATEINDIIKQLQKEYEIKNLGPVSYHLGINIERNKERNFALHQTNKISEMVEKFNQKDMKTDFTTIRPGYLKLDDEENLLLNKS